MKTFLDAWLLEAPMGLSQELAGTVKLIAVDVLPETKDTISLQVELQGGFRGSFWVMADAEALARLFVAARVTPDEQDRQRDAALWQGIIRQVAERAAKTVARNSGVAVSVLAIRESPHPVGITPAVYEMRFGDTSVRVAFDDETKPAVEKKPRENTPVANLPARGVELLLDVELEASLRFGSKEMPLSEVLELGPGDVVQLERHVSDPVDLIVGDKIVARGEVVLVNGNFGLRVTEVAEPRKSLESIRCLF
ncbi:MAG TPA: FliM/FliN family flagellar motor switch protein [Alloacidobacterium sp.]|nr:FliM/FliN family flagellar motor switch protein [Alloacidobacterium sp.]